MTGASVIIFDSSVLYGRQPDDPKFDLLLALRQSGQQKAAIPWMVREELVAHRVLRHAQAHREAVSAIRELNRVTGTDNGELGQFNRDAASDRWRTEYDRLFRVIDTSGEAARQALVREANCQRPAKEGVKDKGGARDAAIWLSVVEYLKNNPDEKV
jgi:PIN domain